MESFIFVYNAKTGIGNLLLDVAHKVLKPDTYPCSLCELTYGNLGERLEWKKFRQKFPNPLQFFHIDDFEKKFKTTFEYPVVLKHENGELEVFLHKSQMDEMKDVSELINAFTVA